MDARAHDRSASVVLIFRALQVGDMLCAIPALRALRQHFARSTLILVGLPWVTQLLPRYAPYIDQVLTFPGHPELPEQAVQASKLADFYRHLQWLNADIAIQLHGSGEVSNRIVQSFGVRRMIGYFKDRPGDGTFITWPERGHEIRRCLALPRALGARPDNESLTFPITDDDTAELAETGWRATLHEQDYVCIHAGARSADRRWPAACFARVADALAATGYTIVLTGSAAECSLAEHVRQQMRFPALNAASSYSLGALAVLLRDARLLVCNDTGVSHLAAALKLRSVVVFTGSDPERWAPLDTRLHQCIVDSSGERVADVIAVALDQLAGRDGMASATGKFNGFINQSVFKPGG